MSARDALQRLEPWREMDWTPIDVGGLRLEIARSQDELEALQRLRFRVFTRDVGASFPLAVEGRDADSFDPWCVHFMVVERCSGQVVGTYRVLLPEATARLGDTYTDAEFDLRSLDALRARLVEVGRSCIDARFRHGTAIMLLWSGLARLMVRGGYRYMLGCASVSVRDGGAAASAVWRRARLKAGSAGRPWVLPRRPYPLDRLDCRAAARIPPLIKGYLRIGATICGAPAWDPDFGTADFPIFLDLDWLDARYRRHFGMP